MCVCMCVCVYAVSMSAPLSSLVLCKFLLFIHVLNNPLYKLAEALCFFISACISSNTVGRAQSRERERGGGREREMQKERWMHLHSFFVDRTERGNDNLFFIFNILEHCTSGQNQEPVYYM